MQYRLAQLRAIDLALKATLPTAATAPLVLLGDLNFRCVAVLLWLVYDVVVVVVVVDVLDRCMIPSGGRDVVQLGNISQDHCFTPALSCARADLVLPGRRGLVSFGVFCDPRVEMLSETQDKAKGGNDFQEVRKVYKFGDLNLVTLFLEAGRQICKKGDGKSGRILNPGASLKAQF